MKAFWKQFVFLPSLATAASLFLATAALPLSLQAQEVEDEETELLEEEAETDGEEVEAEESSETADGESAGEVKEATVKGPDPNAKGAPASPYMHGVSDERATAIDLETLLSDDQKKIIASGEALPAGVGVGKGVIVALSNDKVKLGNSLLSADLLQDNRGEILRFHIWLKGENIVAENALWTKAPTVELSLFDDNGNQVAAASSLFKTRGTFPWHNYYIDLVLPRNFALSGKAKAAAADDELADIFGFTTNDVETTQPGLYLTLSNFGGGAAWFGGLSYERIEAKSQKKSESWLDDATATMAPNPEYDELPMLLFYGLDTKLPWRFLNGNKAFAGIRTKTGLQEYLENARNDWFQMQKGVAMLPYLYVTANTLLLSDGFEEGWSETLRKFLTDSQDKATGFWKVGDIPNLLVTSAIARQCFSPTSLRHSDRVPTPTPWNALAPEDTLPNARQIVRSLLAQRVGNTPAWNEFAFQPDEIGGFFRKTRTDLTATSAAVQLLANAQSVLDIEDPEYNLAADAIRDAYAYAVANFVLRDSFLWCENNTKKIAAASPEGFFELLNTTRVLEHSVNPSLPLPQVTAKRTGSESSAKIQVIWKGTEKDLVAVRFYAAPADVNPNTLTEKNIIGVIERPNATPAKMDPLFLARRCAKAARLKWGVLPADLNAEYVAEKLTALGKALGKKTLTEGTSGEKTVTMNVSSPEAFEYEEGDAEIPEIKVYAVGVNAYGETTRCIPIDEEADDEE